MSSYLSTAVLSGASEVPARVGEPGSERVCVEVGRTGAEARATAVFRQRFWEAQMVFLTASRTRSGLLHLLEAAEQRAALQRLAQAGRELAAAQSR